MAGTTPRSARLALPAGPDSPGQARRFVQRQLSGWGLDGLVDDISLVTTELVTNAVLHARSELEVVLEVGDRVRLEVHDRSVRLPAMRTPSTLTATGRGLRLVELLAGTWGAEPTGTGKVVWCEFAMPAATGGTWDGRSAAGSSEAGYDRRTDGPGSEGRKVGRLLVRRLAGRRVA
ncbi:MAG: ATP-binding protein [Acidimicrobiales bacterium]